MMTTIRALLLSLLLSASAAFAYPAWVSDEFEITLRSGPSTSNAIQLMVGSGRQLEVLERDADSGYSRVRTPGGTEGWVLTRYLMDERSAREQVQRLITQLSSANSRGTNLDTQLTDIRSEYDASNRRIATLEREKTAVEQELAAIKRTAANVLGVNEQNTALMNHELVGWDLSATRLPGLGLLRRRRREIFDHLQFYKMLANTTMSLDGD